jgi:hypothetical protein
MTSKTRKWPLKTNFEGHLRSKKFLLSFFMGGGGCKRKGPQIFEFTPPPNQIPLAMALPLSPTSTTGHNLSQTILSALNNYKFHHLEK